MKTSTLDFDLPRSGIVNPILYTSGHACHQFAHRYLKQYACDGLAAAVHPIHQRSNRALLRIEARGKCTVEEVERTQGELVAAMTRVPLRMQVQSSLDRNRVKRQIIACCNVKYLKQRSDEALSLEGIHVAHKRHHYRTAGYAPRVHLTAHALARFMERARLPPEALIQEIFKITLLSRFVEKAIGPERPIAFALPQGLLHGRTGQGVGPTEFGWIVQNSDDLLTKRAARIAPRGTGTANRDIDFVTFYDPSMLTAHLSGVYAMLVQVQTDCFAGAVLEFADEFLHRPMSEEERSRIALARATLKTALASPPWQAYLRHREDQEARAALAAIPAQPFAFGNPFGGDTETPSANTATHRSAPTS